MTQEKPRLGSSERLMNQMPWLACDIYVAMMRELEELLLMK